MADSPGARESGAKGPPGFGDTSDLWDLRTQRKFWLDVMSRAMDVYLRSPAFLELVQYGLRAATGAGASPQNAPGEPRTGPNVVADTAPPEPPGERKEAP
jgi:hypothetical protein